MKTLFTPFLDGYAYGWGVGSMKLGTLKDSLLLVEHGGGINGFNTMISRIPADKQLVVLLNNTGGAPLSAIRKNILNILYGQPVEPPKKSIAEALRQPASNQPLDKLRATFNTLKADKAYSLNEDDINALGYELMRSGNVSQAVAVLTLNAEAFPNSYNVYDSRGEAYMNAGDKAAAIRDYKKSVEMNPRNTNGYAKLKELGEAVEMPKQTEMAVDSAALTAYVGNYQLAPSFSISVTQQGSKLFGQATGQSAFELFPEAKDRFFLKVVDAQVSFQRNEKGEVDQLTLHQNGRDMPGKRVP